MDKLQRVLNGNDNSPNAGNPSIMNEVYNLPSLNKF